MADRTKAFAVRVIRVFGALPRSDEARVIGRQMLRSGTSVGAHGREAFRSRSDAELISKLEVAIQELDETVYWFELLIESKLVPPRRLAPLLTEAEELMSILVASVRTIKRRRR
ncbi:MAG TPA: four helix bundle protein [Thermoanaerobaculia bacterium]